MLRYILIAVISFAVGYGLLSFIHMFARAASAIGGFPPA